MIETLNQLMVSISYGVAALILISPFYLKRRFTKAHIASLAITLGIFGTFFGVFIGLLNFNPDEITESIPKLIEGLQTAFITSIAGLLTNLLLRISPSVYGLREKGTGSKSDDTGEKLIEAVNRLSYNIAGDGDSTMITQLQKIRTTNSDGFDKMNHSFEEFAEKVVADSTQSLIDALTEVMRDFNAQINEQFGDNFKQLNEAVGAMLDWQREYKDHVEKLVSQFQSVSNNITNIEKSLAQTAESNDVIFETNELLKDTIRDLSQTVGSFSELGEKAKDSFPIIEKNLEALTQTSNSFVRETVAGLRNNYDNFSETQRKLLESYKANIERMIADNADRIKNLDTELGKELNKSLETLGSQLTSLSQHFVNDYKPLTQRLKEVVEISKDLR